MQRTLRTIAALAITLTIAAAATLTSVGHAVTTPPAPTFRIDEIDGIELDAPLWVGGAPGSGDTIYAAEQGGRIWSINGTEKVLFLDARRLVVSGGEQGLLSMAFARDYATSGRFFIYFTRPGGNGQVRQYIARNGVVVNGSGRVVIDVPLSPPNATNHNGGNLWAGPSGTLYLSVGDGGGGGVERLNSQRMNVLMGKLIRITPRAGGGYTIPSTNPFFTRAGARREIYALGLRNPFRFSIDGATGDIWIGDVGQGEREEIDRLRAGRPAGANFGWPRMEGNRTFSASTRLAPGTTYAKPFLDYGRPNGECSVTGGVVYRGPVVSLRGFYLYTDFCSDVIRTVHPTTGRRSSHTGANGIVHFGTAAGGTVVLASVTEGRLYRIVAP